MSGIHPEALPLGVWLKGDAGTRRRSCIVTPEHVALPQPHRSMPAAAPRVCRLNRPDMHAGMPRGGGARGVSALWLYICYNVQWDSTSLICVFFRRYLMAVTDILHWKHTVLFCFNLTGNSGLVGPSTDRKRVFEGLDFFKKPQMNIHLWIQLLLWLLFFKLLAS